MSKALCVECGKEFERANNARKCCSDECSKARRKRQKREDRQRLKEQGLNPNEKFLSSGRNIGLKYDDLIAKVFEKSPKALKLWHDENYQGIMFNCQFYDKGKQGTRNRCKALKKLYCAFETCNFYRGDPKKLYDFEDSRTITRKSTKHDKRTTRV